MKMSQTSTVKDSKTETLRCACKFQLLEGIKQFPIRILTVKDGRKCDTASPLKMTNFLQKFNFCPYNINFPKNTKKHKTKFPSTLIY